MKKILSVILAGVMALSLLAGCGNNGGTTNGGETSSSMSVEVIAKGFQHDFWKAVKTGADKAAAELNVKVNFVGPEGEGAVASQVEMLNNAINKKPSAIALAALDTSAAVDSIKNAMSANIPIIGFDSGVPDAPEGAIYANAATDNLKAGELAAEKAFEAIKDKVVAAASGSVVRIGVVAQEANSQSITQRTKGFVDKMVELIEALPEYGAGKVSVIGHDKFANGVANAQTVIEVRIPAEITDAAGKTEAQALLNKDDLICIYGSNEFAAKAIINANDAISGGRLGTDKVIAVGFDSGSLQIDAIKNGVFYGAVTQDPVSIGYNAVKLAVEAAQGKEVADVDTGAQWYNAENIDSAEIAPLLYQ